MGNTQCGFLTSSSNKNNQYQYISQENHVIFQQIHHVKNLLTQQHVAIKKILFNSEKQYKKYEKIVQNLVKLPKPMPYVQILKNQKIDQQSKDNKKNPQNQLKFKCNDTNIFKTASQQNQLSCIVTKNKFPYTIHLQYYPYDNFCLEHIIQEKYNNFQEYFETNKIVKNMQFDLFQKLKLNQYQKIDQLPPKQRKFINQFYTEIQILRILDSLISAIFGTKIFNLTLNQIDPGIRPGLIFRNQQGKFLLLLNEVIQLKSNIQLTIERLRNLLRNPQQQNKQQQIIQYLHPSLFSQIILYLLLEEQQYNQNKNQKFFKISQQMMQKQNIFALGLIMIQICLFQPNICSKIYQVNINSKMTNNSQDNKRNQLFSSISCLPKQTQLSQKIVIKIKQNVIHKYLSMIKTKYSQNLVKLIGKMIFNTQRQGYSNYQYVINQITNMIRQNVEKLKNVYGSTKNSRPDSLQKLGRPSKSGTVSNNSPQLSTHSSTSIPTLSYSSSYSLLPLQSHQPILSFQMLKKFYQKIQNRAQNILVKQQINLLSKNPLLNQKQLEQLIQKDQKRILNELNKIQQQNSSKNKNRSDRFSYRKLDNKTPNQSIKTKINQSNKINQQSQQKQKRINSTTKLKQQKFQNAYQEQMLGSISCQTITQKDIIKDKINSFSKNQYFQRIVDNQFRKSVGNFQSSKTDLKSLIKSKNTYKNNLGQKDSYKNTNNPSKMNSQNLYQIYLKQYQQLLQKQKTFY